MSTTSTKRPLADAVRDAEAFRDLFVGCAEEWVIAGSVRRRKAECGDVEHVVRPAFAERDVRDGLFIKSLTVNLLWHRCDELLAAGAITKHVYQVNRADGGTGERFMWGENYRGIEFNGYLHEVFTAKADNWGAILAIRTGPADFSKMLVTTIRNRGLKQEDGFVRYIGNGNVYPVRTEEAFFDACGVKWVEPEARR